jgi:hypothetical protein
MTPEKRALRKRLAERFARLSKRNLDRLVEHERRKTPICCGPDANLYANGTGGG